jgi:hypothetical protein
MKYANLYGSKLASYLILNGVIKDFLFLGLLANLMAALETSNGYTLHCDNADFECCDLCSRYSKFDHSKRFYQLRSYDFAAIRANSGAYIYFIITSNA